MPVNNISPLLLAELGYRSHEIKALSQSGIVALDVSGGADLELLSLFSSDPIDIFGPDFNLDQYEPISIGDRRILLLDKVSGSAFSPIELRPAALFGREGLDAAPQLSESRPHATMRSRYNKINLHIVHDEHELRAICESARKRSNSTSGPVVFRGQDKNYTVSRHPSVKRLLFGDESSEVSLSSKASRTNFDYLSAEPYLKAIYQDLRLRLTGEASRTMYVESGSDWLGADNDGQFSLTLFQVVAALAQVYGVPSFGLGVTDSFEAAWCIATQEADSIPRDWRGAPVEQWPVIHILRTGDMFDTRSLDLPLSRAVAQANRVVTGSWGAHDNVCAHDLLGTVVLAPELARCPVNRAELFPGPEQDHILRELLNLRETAARLSEKAGLNYLVT
jgi:hypothetical protein